MVTITGLDARTPRLSLAEKLWSLNWGLLLLLMLVQSSPKIPQHPLEGGRLQLPYRR